MKIVAVVGARPQFIKLAPLHWAAQARENLHLQYVHTGQHYDREMSAVFFEDLDLAPPDREWRLQSAAPLERLLEMTQRLGDYLLGERPDWVLVFGDTDSTLAGSLAARLGGFRLAHVEAGLRSFNKQMPEEFNRITADAAADLLFCSNQRAVERLQREGNPAPAIFCGDLMYDALLHVQGRRKDQHTVYPELGSGFALLTIHRQANLVAERVEQWLEIIRRLSTEMPVVFLAHPRTRQVIAGRDMPKKVQVLEPQGYRSTLDLLARCQLVLTDSGGLQKDAFFMQKPCLTLRPETEWEELTALGVNCLTDLNWEAIQSARATFTRQNLDFSAQPFGDGQAAEKILISLEKYRL